MRALSKSMPKLSHCNLGLACYVTGDYNGAIAALEQASSLQPGLAGARLYLGISYYRTNRFPKALGALEAAPELAEGNPAALYWLGATYRALGRLSEAIPLLEAAQGRDTSNTEVLDLLARTYSERSGEWFGQLLSTAEGSPPARLLRAEELAMDGVTNAALEELRIALEQDPGLPGLHLLRGQALSSGEEFDKSAEAFRSELENDPLSLESHLRLGAYLLDLGKPSEALRHLRLWQLYRPGDERGDELLEAALQAGAIEEQPERAVSEPDGSAPTLQNARDAYREGNATLAASLLERLLEGRPDWEEARRMLARCRITEGNYRLARNELLWLERRTPGDPETLYLLGKTYERLASQAAERLFELNPSSPRIRLLRGESFERGPRHEFERALEEYLAARIVAPDDPAVHHAIGRVLFKMKRYEEALPHLETALGLNPSHGMANYFLGKVRMLQGNRNTAIPPLRLAVRAKPELVDARRDLAAALVFDGHLEEGIKAYEELLADHPRDASLHALLAAAYRRAGRIEEAKAQAEKVRDLDRR